MRVSTETVTFAGMHHTRAPLVVGTYPLLKDNVPWPLDDPPTSLDRTVDIYKQEQKINKKQQIKKQTKRNIQTLTLTLTPEYVVVSRGQVPSSFFCSSNSN